jgi:predicted N-acetyltransferase YhbS
LTHGSIGGVRPASLPTIRPMTPEDVPAAAAALLDGGWVDQRLFFTFSAGNANSRPFVAVSDGEIVGTAVGTINRPVGWVGAVFVAKAARRQGLGGALTEAAIDALAEAGCRTFVLVATNEGRPIYERRGFEVQTHYHIVEARGTGGGDTPLVQLEPDDLDAAVSLDRQATGEDREHVIRAFATDGVARCLKSRDGSVRGFVIRAPWGGGATVASSQADAIAILEARRAIVGAEKSVRAGLLSENREGLDRLIGLGWKAAWTAPRLARGEPLAWRPTWLWGQFNFAIG